MKTLKYSRKQIAEAIRFWSKILENTSPFIDALVDAYGYDQVFADVKRKVTMKDIERIHKLANEILFGNKLKEIQIYHDDTNECARSNALILFSYVTYEDGEKTCLLDQKGVDSDGTVYLPPRLIASDQILNGNVEMNIVSLANVVVHEMIHQHIVENANSDMLDKLRKSENQGHIEEFVQMMLDLNEKHGLNIQIKGSTGYQEDSVKKLNDFAKNESDEQDESELQIVRKHENGFTEVFLA